RYLPLPDHGRDIVAQDGAVEGMLGGEAANERPGHLLLAGLLEIGQPFDPAALWVLLPGGEPGRGEGFLQGPDGEAVAAAGDDRHAELPGHERAFRPQAVRFGEVAERIGSPAFTQQ